MARAASVIADACTTGKMSRRATTRDHVPYRHTPAGCDRVRALSVAGGLGTPLNISFHKPIEHQQPFQFAKDSQLLCTSRC
jgi:hypothetical protein